MEGKEASEVDGGGEESPQIAAAEMKPKESAKDNSEPEVASEVAAPDAGAAPSAGKAGKANKPEEESMFRDVSHETAKILARQIFANEIVKGEETLMKKMTALEGDTPGTQRQRTIDGLTYNFTVPANMVLQAGDEVYLVVPKAQAVHGIEMPNKDEDDLFPDDAGLPGADASIVNWLKRKVRKATCGFVNLGIMEEDPERPDFHVSYRLAKSRRNEQSLRHKLEKDQCKQEFKIVKIGEPMEWVDVVDADGNPVLEHAAGEYVPYAMSELIPFFHFPGQQFLCPRQYANQKSIMDECGMGVVGYFKLVKSLAVIFGIMSVLVLPNLIMFSQSNSIPPRELFYSGLVNSQTVLATSTISNLAEPIPFCRESLDGQKFKFKCPTGFYINSVVAFYGQPVGSCGCPFFQQVDFKSACRGTIEAVNGTNVCAANDGDDDSYSGMDTLPCFPALTRFGNRCCSLEHLPFSTVGNLNSLELGATAGCNSLTAPFLAEALCKNQNSCEFDVDDNTTLNVTVSKIPKYGAGVTDLSAICKNANYLTTGYCQSSFGHNMDVSSCATGGLYSSASTGAVVKSDYRLMFEAVCQLDVITLGSATGANTVLDDEYIVYVATTLNALSILCFLLGIFWIQLKLDKQAEKSGAETCTAGDYTVMMHTLPKEARTVKEVKAGLKAFFERTLREEGGYDVPVTIADINVTTGADDYLNALKARGEAAQKVDEAVGAIQSRWRRGVWYALDKETGEYDVVAKASAPLLGQLRSALLKFEIANDEAQSLSRKARKYLSKAYVTFSHEILRARALYKYPSIGLLTHLTQREEDKLDGQTVFMERAPEPEEIIFENVPVPEWNRFLRFIIGTWMTLLLLGVSYAMIYEAKNLSTLWSGNEDKINCAVFDVNTARTFNTTGQRSPSSTITYTDVLYDRDPAAYEANTTSSSWGSYNYLKCFCSQVAYDSQLNGDKDPMGVMKSYQFYDKSSDSYQKYCDIMLSGSTISMAANYIATFVIVVVNANLSFFMAYLVDFEKHANATGRIMSMMIKLFIAQYINTAFLSLIISGDISRAGGTNIKFGTGEGSLITFGIFTGTTQDYDTTWYTSVGSSIMFTMFMFTIGNQPTVLLGVFLKWLGRVMDRKWSFTPDVTHVDTQKALDKLYIGPEIEMNLKYAAILTLVFVDMTYSATCPLFNFITFMNLVVIYVSDKYMLFHLFKKPPVLNAALPRVVLNMLYFAAGIHVLNGMWMWGNNAFYDPDVMTYYNTFTQTIPSSGATVQALDISHGWIEPIEVLDRLYGHNSRFLFAMACLIGLMLAVKVLAVIFYDVLAGQILLEYLHKQVGPEAAFNPFPRPKNIEDRLEYNPTYFAAINVDSLKVRMADADLTKGMEKTYRALLKTHAEALAAVEAEGSGTEALPASPPASPAKGPEPAAVAALGAEGDAEAGAAGADAGANADAESGAAAGADASVSARVRQGLVSVNKAKLAHLRVQEEAMRAYLGAVVNPADIAAALHEHIVKDGVPEGSETDGKANAYAAVATTDGAAAVAGAADAGAAAAGNAGIKLKEKKEKEKKEKEAGCGLGLCAGAGDDEEEFEYSYSLGRNSEGELVEYTYKTIEGHESYNMSTVPRYTAAFGFDSDHMDRYFSDPAPGSMWEGHEARTKDWMIESKAFKSPDDDDAFTLDLIRANMPKRVRVTFKVPKRDPVTDKKTGEVEEVEKMVIPWQAPLLDAYFGMCGGVRCVNNRAGCECISEPEGGVQGKWTNPFAKAPAEEGVKEGSKEGQEGAEGAAKEAVAADASVEMVEAV